MFHDHDRVLLVQPAHSPTRWTIPGGPAEDDEDPHSTARRKVTEEIGLTLSPTAPLLAIDWVPAVVTTNRPPTAVYVFDGGRLDPNQARRLIRLQDSELLDWRYAGPADWAELVATHVQRRLQACLQAVNTGAALYLHHGWQPGVDRDEPQGAL